MGILIYIWAYLFEMRGLSNFVEKAKNRWCHQLLLRVCFPGATASVAAQLRIQSESSIRSSFLFFVAYKWLRKRSKHSIWGMPAYSAITQARTAVAEHLQFFQFVSLAQRFYGLPDDFDHMYSGFYAYLARCYLLFKSLGIPLEAPNLGLLMNFSRRQTQQSPSRFNDTSSSF